MLFPILGLVGFAGTVIFAILMIVMILRDKPFVIPLGLMLVFALLVGVSCFMIIRGDSGSADKSTVDQSALGKGSEDSSSETLNSSGSEDKTDSPQNTYSIGETWTVSGQWELTITGVTETKERNQYSDKNPGAVYIVDYTYKNLGYEKENWDGLFIPIGETVVDNSGKMCGTYPGDTQKNPQETPVGAVCDAQECIYVEVPGDFQLTVTLHDGNDVRQSAVFLVSVG